MKMAAVITEVLSSVKRCLVALPLETSTSQRTITRTISGWARGSLPLITAAPHRDPGAEREARQRREVQGADYRLARLQQSQSAWVRGLGREARRGPARERNRGTRVQARGDSVFQSTARYRE